MTGPTRSLFALAAAGVLLTAAGGGVQAQPQGPGPGQQQDLAAVLHLRPDQMASYHSYQAASQPGPDELARLRGASPQVLAGLTTPQRLDRIGAFMGAQQQVFRRQADATRAFYGQLSPDQQHTFDQLTTPPPNSRRGRPQ